MHGTALVVGASGITGSNLARELIADEWTTYGLARNPRHDVDGMLPVAADLLDPVNLPSALANIAPTHVFITTWMRNATESEMAVDAYAQFGKGRHSAKLNMGDCYSYACAKVNKAKLLFKGDDFTKTDIQSALV